MEETSATSDMPSETPTPSTASSSAPSDTSPETPTAAGSSAVSDTPSSEPQDIFEQTKALQLQAWQAQSNMDSLLGAMTPDELTAYVDEVAVRQQATEEGSSERAVWDALKFAAEFKRENKQPQETEEHTNE